jgi:hypothetical protein
MTYLKNQKMKKIILFTFLVIFSLGAFAITPDLKSKSDNNAVPAKKENKMSEKEISRLTKRAEYVNGVNMSPQTVIVQEGHRNRRGHDGMNGDYRRHSSVVFVGGGAAILLILLIILLV